MSHFPAPVSSSSGESSTAPKGDPDGTNGANPGEQEITEETVEKMLENMQGTSLLAFIYHIFWGMHFDA